MPTVAREVVLVSNCWTGENAELRTDLEPSEALGGGVLRGKAAMGLRVGAVAGVRSSGRVQKNDIVLGAAPGQAPVQSD